MTGPVSRGSAPLRADLEVALRRVVVGYRAIAVLWMSMLGVAALVTGRAQGAVVVGSVALAVGWAAATAAVAERRRVVASWRWLLADMLVSAGLILGPPALAGETATYVGGYPFSTVVVAAWARGMVGAMPVAAGLAAATVLRPGFVAAAADVAPPEVLDTVVFYLVAAAVLSWGIGVLRRFDDARRAAEEALGQARADQALAEERAETAAHLHDSVLQTLALVQRRSAEPAEVTALARRQERELRDWLNRYRSPGPAPGSAGGERTSLAAAIRAAAAEVEASYPIRVEVVTVGDTALDDGSRAVAAALREAMTNAAKHAGVETVAVFAEAGDDRIEAFARDRGCGFDPQQVGSDRRGISESIVARIERHGGEARIRSEPGGGTEVRISLERHAPVR